MALIRKQEEYALPDGSQVTVTVAYDEETSAEDMAIVNRWLLNSHLMIGEISEAVDGTD